jgi:hypothetical protein
MLGGTSLGLGSALPACESGATPSSEPVQPRASAAGAQREPVANDPVLGLVKLGAPPWPESDPVHPRSSGRFAIHPNGRKERGV